MCSWEGPCQARAVSWSVRSTHRMAASTTTAPVPALPGFLLCTYPANMGVLCHTLLCGCLCTASMCLADCPFRHASGQHHQIMTSTSTAPHSHEARHRMPTAIVVTVANTTTKLAHSCVVFSRRAISRSNTPLEDAVHLSDQVQHVMLSWAWQGQPCGLCRLSSSHQHIDDAS